MLHTVIPSILEQLRTGFADKGSIILLNGTPVPLNADHFEGISSGRKELITFIDGGNQEIIGAPHFSLQLIRVCGIRLGDSKKIIRREFFVLITSEKKDRVVYSVKVFGNDACFKDVQIEEEKLTVGDRPVSIQTIGNVCRRISELRLARELCSGIIVLDGSLDVLYPHEQEEMDFLIREAESKNVFLCGLCKTTRVFTDTGYSAVGALMNMAPSGSWFYHPVVERPLIDSAFVKLHTRSDYIFRFDFIKGKRFENTLDILSTYSTDPVFLGYPYGLIEADKYARVTNREVAYYRTLLLAKAGEFQKDIQAQLRALDAHYVLDRI